MTAPATAIPTAIPTADTGHPNWSALCRRPGRGAYLIVTLAVVATFLLYSGLYPQPFFPFDDAYLTLHNAQVLRWGSDPNYVGTPALVGATSVIHTLIVAGLMAFFSPAWALMLAQWIGILMYAWGVVDLARTKQLSNLATSLLLVVALLVYVTPYQLLNGLETGWAMAAIVWALSFAARPTPSPLLPVLCGVLPFLRPELIVLSVSLVGAQLYRRYRQGEKLRGCLLDLALAGAAALPWIVVTYLNTGHVIPNTISAKRLFFAEAQLPFSVKYEWLTRTIWMFARGLGVFALMLAFLSVDPLGLPAAIFIACFLLSYFLEFPGALGHYWNRYLFVLVPLLLSAAASGLVRQQKAVRKCAFLLLTVSSISAVASFPPEWHKYVEERRHTLIELNSVAEFCSANLPVSARVMVHDAGYIAFGTKLQLIDLVGLKTPLAMRFNQALTFPSGGALRGEAIHRLAMQNQPDYFVVLEEWDRIFRITSELRRRGWDLGKIRNAPEGDGFDPGRHYAVYKMTYTAPEPSSLPRS